MFGFGKKKNKAPEWRSTPGYLSKYKNHEHYLNQVQTLLRGFGLDPVSHIQATTKKKIMGKDGALEWGRAAPLERVIDSREALERLAGMEAVRRGSVFVIELHPSVGHNRRHNGHNVAAAKNVAYTLQTVADCDSVLIAVSRWTKGGQPSPITKDDLDVLLRIAPDSIAIVLEGGLPSVFETEWMQKYNMTLSKENAVYLTKNLIMQRRNDTAPMFNICLGNQLTCYALNEVIIDAVDAIHKHGASVVTKGNRRNRSRRGSKRAPGGSSGSRGGAGGSTSGNGDGADVPSSAPAGDVPSPAAESSTKLLSPGGIPVKSSASSALLDAANIIDEVGGSVTIHHRVGGKLESRKVGYRPRDDDPADLRLRFAVDQDEITLSHGEIEFSHQSKTVPYDVEHAEIDERIKECYRAQFHRPTNDDDIVGKFYYIFENFEDFLFDNVGVDDMTFVMLHADEMNEEALLFHNWALTVLWNVVDKHLDSVLAVKELAWIANLPRAVELMLTTLETDEKHLSAGFHHRRTEAAAMQLYYRDHATREWSRSFTAQMHPELVAVAEQENGNEVTVVHAFGNGPGELPLALTADELFRKYGHGARMLCRLLGNMIKERRESNTANRGSRSSRSSRKGSRGSGRAGPPKK